MSVKIKVLQALRLKGRVAAAHVASATGLEEAYVARMLTELQDAGHCAEVNGHFKITKDGKGELERRIAKERATLDQVALGDAYREFDAFNSELKQLMTDWQMKDGSMPNDHSDPEYDREIVARLSELHDRFVRLLDRIVGIVPRLGHYPRRFAAALDRIKAGDHGWVAHPLVDSYHTVWFELHEDLIGTAGLSRIEEAAAGRA
ncbi:hypothetical protein ACW2Q0_07515 [Nocardia sp. R16R-3T]